ncbi:LysR family transcriptional regulator [Serratia sp. DD3]|uniref:LysR family transcriptional regulator n=1 Tax=Serratia sp. DD3 TaxID=1410619 RepID=UPI0003C4EBA5|nr:LysR family transcriptional regulator [Serratia sp. DD3]KEY60289.1 HTH-type transcriptional regulator CynR [Serratia sp. DD3]
MNDSTSTIGTTLPDWNLLRVFLAVVDAGSLTGASRLLHSSQPTLSRQIAELESLLGITLFERAARGLRLTVSGLSLVALARKMESAAQAISLSALGQNQQLDGCVRLTASEMTSAYILPPILQRFRQNYPQIQIELLASDNVENLLERQADIAIRHVRPQQGGLVAKKLGDVNVGAFAHSSYLERVGGIVDWQYPERYDWIGLDTSDRLLRAFNQSGVPVTREFFAFRCDNHIVCWQAALAGLGISFAPYCIASRWPEMLSVMPVDKKYTMPLWLTTHRELRHNTRIRLVFDALQAGLQIML